MIDVRESTNYKFHDLLNYGNQEIKKIQNEILANNKKYPSNYNDELESIKMLNFENYPNYKNLNKLIKRSKDLTIDTGFQEEFSLIKEQGLGLRYKSEIRMMKKLNMEIYKEYNLLQSSSSSLFSKLYLLDIELAKKKSNRPSKMNTKLTRTLNEKLDFDYSIFISDYFNKDYTYMRDKKVTFLNNIIFFENIINIETNLKYIQKLDLNSLKMKKKYLDSYAFVFIGSIIFMLFIGILLYMFKVKIRRF